MVTIQKTKDNKMKTKDINKIKELIAQRLDDQYDIKANWEIKDTRNGDKLWVHTDDVFEISVFYWTMRETNRGSHVVKPVAERNASVVMQFTDRWGNKLNRTMYVDFYDGVNIPEENIDQVKISTHTDVQVGAHHVASYNKDFQVDNRSATLDNYQYNGGNGYMRFIWEIFDGKG